MTEPVGVVVPTRNRADVLLLTLRSILRQRDVEVEVVVVDEASTDDTAARVRALGDPRIRLVRHEEARGAAAARNAGWRAHTTRLVAFCDDDDLWAPTKLARQLEALERAPGCRWAVCGAVLIDEHDRIIDHQRPDVSGDVVASLVVANTLPAGGSGVLAERSLVEEVGGFDESRLRSEDWDLWVRLALRSPLATVDEPLVAYRIWSGGKSRTADLMEEAWEAITGRYADVAAARGVTADRRHHRRYLAKQQLRNGDRVGAARTFWRLGTIHGDRGSLLRVPMALAAPRLTDRLGTRRARAQLPAGYVAAGRAWLDALHAELAAAPS